MNDKIGSSATLNNIFCTEVDRVITVQVVSVFSGLSASSKAQFVKTGLSSGGLSLAPFLPKYSLIVDPFALLVVSNAESVVSFVEAVVLQVFGYRATHQLSL